MHIHNLIQHIWGNTISHSNEYIIFQIQHSSLCRSPSFIFELAVQTQLKHRWWSVSLFPICHLCSRHSDARVRQVTYRCTSPHPESLVEKKNLEMCHKCLGREGTEERHGEQEREDTARRKDGTWWLLLFRWMWGCLLQLKTPNVANPQSQADLYNKNQLLSTK